MNIFRSHLAKVGLIAKHVNIEYFSNVSTAVSGVLISKHVSDHGHLLLDHWPLVCCRSGRPDVPDQVFQPDRCWHLSKLSTRSRQKGKTMMLLYEHTVNTYSNVTFYHFLKKFRNMKIYTHWEFSKCIQNKNNQVEIDCIGYSIFLKCSSSTATSSI